MAEAAGGNAPLLEALSNDALARDWPPAVLARAAGLRAAVGALQATAEGATRRLRATVQGSRAYAVELVHAPGVRLRAQCDCPHARGGHPCKHAAALAMVWRAQLGAAVVAAPAAPPVQEPAWAAFVRRQPSEALAQRLLDWAGVDPGLRRNLQAWAALAEPASDTAAARRAVGAFLAAPSGGLHARTWPAHLRRAQGVLGLIDGWLAERPALAAQASTWALVRLRRSARRVGDPQHLAHDLLQALIRRWCQAVPAAGWSAAECAAAAESLLADDREALVDRAAVLAALPPEAVARWGQRQAERWAVLRDQADADPIQRDAAKRAWHGHLIAAGDGPGELDLLRQDLRSADDHLALVQALQRWGRPREAVQAAEQAWRAHPQHPGLEAALLAVYERDGWDDEVLALRRAAFERAPSVAAYHALLQAAAQAGADVALERERCWALLDNARGFTAETLAGLRLDLWRSEGRFDEALTWLSVPRPLPALALRRWVQALPAAHDAAAADWLKRLLADELRHARPPFEGALALVRDTLTRLSPEAGRLWLAWLKLEHRAQPAFVQALRGL
ncbi:MAG: SWIM zinc finger domain-containing protein [Inhella sp.]|uniref:SWIM zinc finger family protein n=1 Tax=Inhella sp. TaxID=1921806 RepID=UPI0022CB50C9|nr:SWIM zinc finger family protein [Inhella sp.]MCZ8235247.1 SWIM zinc finger domain-containing protein [Inhella sp.]